MDIKLKTFGLPSTSAEWLQPLSRSSASSAYQTVGDGIFIPEVYLQDSTGVIAGVRLGTEHNILIPARYADRFYRGDKLVIGDQVFEINDIIEHFYRDNSGNIMKSNSGIESHYVLNITNPND